MQKPCHPSSQFNISSLHGIILLKHFKVILCCSANIKKKLSPPVDSMLRVYNVSEMISILEKQGGRISDCQEILCLAAHEYECVASPPILETNMHA